MLLFYSESKLEDHDVFLTIPKENLLRQICFVKVYDYTSSFRIKLLGLSFGRLSDCTDFV